MKTRIGRWVLATFLGLGLAAAGAGLPHRVAAAPSDAIFAPGASPTGYKWDCWRPRAGWAASGPTPKARLLPLGSIEMTSAAAIW